MKHFLKTMAVFLAITMTFVAIQATCAQATDTVEGTVYSISTDTNTIQVDEGNGDITTVYCIPFTYLAKKGVSLDVGDELSIEVYDRNFSDGTVRLIGVSITVAETTYAFPGNSPNRR